MACSRKREKCTLDSLVYKVSSRAARAITKKPCLKEKTKVKKYNKTCILIHVWVLSAHEVPI